MIISIIQALFSKDSVQYDWAKKKQQRIYDLLNAETKPKFLYLPYTKQRKNFLQEKSFLRKSGSGGLDKKQNEDFLTALAKVIKKDPTASIKKQTNELKVRKKTMRKTV